MLYGGMVAVCFVISMFVPETLGKALPDTIPESEALGRYANATDRFF